MSSSDIKAKTMTASGAMGVGRARIRGMQFLAGAGTAQIVIRDGSATGAIILDAKFLEAVADSMYIPDDGILSVGDPHVTLTNVTQIVILHA